ncbi:MAG: sugar ABC transporter ATP-binding protein [Bdellovibrionota bacterium]
MKPVLNVQGIFKAFQGIPALRDVQLRLFPGEIHALMGENGAGKSTLIKVITGIHTPEAGTIQLDEKVITPKSNFEAQNLGISTVYQEVNLIPTLSVAENIYLGREPRRWGTIDWGSMRKGAIAALAKLDLNIDVDLPLEDYPIAIQQMTAIARALDLNAKVLILDEATSSLDKQEVERLFIVLRKLRSQNLAIVFVTHFLDQVYEISDRITVLRNGQFVIEKETAQLPRTELVAKMMGRELSQVDNEVIVQDKSAGTANKAWLECKNLGRAGSVEPFDLQIKDGEILGLAGLLGSGRTEIARLLFGLDSSTTGTLSIDGKELKFSNPRDAIQQGFALSPEDRKVEAIFPTLSVRENIILALQAHKGWFNFISPKKQKEIADGFIKALGIKTRDAEQPIETLSGGNQQKAILARWLALDPRLLILDEPTRGIDVGAKAEIQKYISKLVATGKSILFISSELEEVVRSCSRVAVLKDRQKIAELEGTEIGEDSIVSVIGQATTTTNAGLH